MGERQELIRRCLQGNKYIDLVLPNDYLDWVIDIGGWPLVKGTSASYFRFLCCDLLETLRGDNDG